MTPAEADRQITAERRETKYLLPAAEARALATRASSELRPHAYSGPGANRLPGADHYITTVYFDTPSADVYRHSLTGDVDTKVRAREYYDDHPDLVELATDPGQMVRYNPVVWLEIKHRDGGRTRKRRVGLPKHDIPRFLAHGEITPAMIELIERDHGASSRAIQEELRGVLDRFDGSLQARALVNYRRRAWQAPDGTIRLTIDDSLAVYAPPADLWSRETPLVRATLGPRLHLMADRIVEVKSRGPLPSWLHEIFGPRPTAELPDRPGVRFSKFLLASGVVGG